MVKVLVLTIWFLVSATLGSVLLATFLGPPTFLNAWAATPFVVITVVGVLVLRKVLSGDSS